MDSYEKPIQNAFTVISFFLIMAGIVMIFGFAYTFLNAKLHNENHNMALVDTDGPVYGSQSMAVMDPDYVVLTEDEDIPIYTGRSRYGAAFGDEGETITLQMHDATEYVDKNAKEYYNSDWLFINQAGIFFRWDRSALKKLI